MKCKIILIVATIFLLVFPKEVYSQQFKVSTLISIPGDNTEFDVLSPEWGFPNSDTYICWINKLDSVYTVYLKQISPVTGDDIIVSSDSYIKSKPRLALNRFGEGIKIVWQCNKQNNWSVYLRNYFENNLSDSTLLLDSLDTDPQISLSIDRLAWIDNGDLLVKEFHSDFNITYRWDSLNCSSPEILKSDGLQYSHILYEKDFSDSIIVNQLVYHHNEDRPSVYKYSQLSSGLLSKNPSYGINGEIAFETYENNICKSVCFVWSDDAEVTKNINCNFKNPVLFTYPIPTSSSSSNLTPFFLVFDTDSLVNNNEIFIKSFYYDGTDSLLNISQSNGADYNPRVSYLSNSDSVFVAIIWEHHESGKTDIWVAKDNFNPPPSAVEDKNYLDNSFKLYQNYPNPFNPSTTIEYTIEKSSDVKLIIYDILGREVAILINDYKNTGNYKEFFNASNLSSGIYYYQLITENQIQTRTMLLLK